MFWGSAFNSDPSGVKSALTTLFQTTLPNSSYYNLLTQYYDSRYMMRRNVATFSGVWVDSTGPSGLVTQAALLSEADRARQNNSSWTDTLDSQWVIVTPQGAQVDQFNNVTPPGLCGRHNQGVVNGNQYFFITLPWLGDEANYCLTVSGNVAQSMVEVASHEFAETATDPNLGGGWYTNNGWEIGDLCEGLNPNWVTVGTSDVQQLYDLSTTNCQSSSNFTFSYSYNGSHQVNPGCSGCGEANHHPYSADLEIVNTGNIAWEVGAGGLVRLGTSNPYDRASGFCDGSWLAGSNCSQIATAQNASKVDSEPIRPGQVAYLAWTFTPAFGVQPAVYVESMDPLAAGILHMSNGALGYNQPVGSFDDTPLTSNPTVTLNRGSSTMVSAKFQNAGTAPWFGNDIVKLATCQPNYRTSVFHDSNWVSSYEPSAVTSDTDPGASYTFSISLTASSSLSPGTYTEHFCPIADSQTYMTDHGFAVTVQVQ